ncbi:MAG: S-layer homology domain-containing protein, partial [Clostridiales bacterium]|nr:S-layer homology domain-containing protein [Clostridiales bacterium]
MKTRKLFIIIVTLIMAMSFMTTAGAAFSDVTDHPYESAIDFCREKGFIMGTSPTSFDPDAKLTRGQLATIWCRSLQLTEINPKFADITELEHYYDTPIIVLYSLGIIKGVSDTAYSPNSYVTREQLALITKRTYALDAADENAYKIYKDHEAISEGARDAVSSCINAGVFEGLYDGKNFLPGEPVTRAEICQLIYNISFPLHGISVDEMSGGTVTPSRAQARVGTTVTLEIVPDEGMQLKEGTLKYNGKLISGNSFKMPNKAVLITAEFEEIPVLVSIRVEDNPDLLVYTEGDKLDLSGMSIIASYSDDSQLDVTALV